jgi:hypothetical protein
MYRFVCALFAVVVCAIPVAAQSVNLSEKSALGERATFAIDLELKGNLILALENGKQQIPLEAKAKHRLTERCVVVTDGLPSTNVRLYAEATASLSVASEKSNRSLSPERKLIIARHNSDGLFCFAPNGPLSRDELDLVSDHFNPQCLPGLLPGKAVNVGDTWPLGNDSVQAACRFDATIKTALTGKLTAVKDGNATFAVDGTAEGLENGAKVSITVTATGSFDIVAGHITSLTWKQKDEREQGPVNPASQLEATVTLKRENAATEPKELSDDAIAGLPEKNLPAQLTDLRFTDAKGRYQILHPRDWHVTGQTDKHLIMRLLDRGELVAQATVTVWNKMEPGQHLSSEDFKKAAAGAPGWTPGKTLLDRELPATSGRWLYQLSIEGKMEDVPVVQTFYLLAGAQGEQVAVTVAAKPDKIKTLGSRDLNLVNSIVFGKQ